MDLSIVIPAKGEMPNLRQLLPQIGAILGPLEIRSECLVVGDAAALAHAAEIRALGGRLIIQHERGYGGALLEGFQAARGEWILTMDADLSHPPTFIVDLWNARETAELVIASRYVTGGRAEMPVMRALLSRVLNFVFRRGLSLDVRDMSSGFRLYRADLVRATRPAARDFNILQELLLEVIAEGWTVREIAFTYCPRAQGASHARMVAFGIAYARSFARLWSFRNSIKSADYDDRAPDSVIPLQRYWQRRRFRHITTLTRGQGPTLDVGCGSSRIIDALPAGSVGVDVLLRKLRYLRRRRAFGPGIGQPVAVCPCEFPMCRLLAGHRAHAQD